MNGTAWVAGIYRGMPDDELERSIEKLGVMVKSLSLRRSTAAEGYREALRIAEAERDRRRGAGRPGATR